MKKQILLLISLCIAYNATHASFKQSTRLAGFTAQARKLAISAAQQAKRVWEHPTTQKIIFSKPIQGIYNHPYITATCMYVSAHVMSQTSTFINTRNIRYFDDVASSVKNGQSPTTSENITFLECEGRTAEETEKIKALIRKIGIPGNYSIKPHKKGENRWNDLLQFPGDEEQVVVFAKGPNDVTWTGEDAKPIEIIYRLYPTTTSGETFMAILCHELGHAYIKQNPDQNSSKAVKYIDKLHYKIRYASNDAIEYLIIISTIAIPLLNPEKTLSLIGILIKKVILPLVVCSEINSYLPHLSSYVKQEEKNADAFAATVASEEEILGIIKWLKKAKTNVEQQLTQKELFEFNYLSSHPSPQSRIDFFNDELEMRRQAPKAQLQAAVATSRLNASSIWK